MDTQYEFTNQEDEAREDDYNAQFGDPRRCPRHPGEITSDPFGLFDAPCGACEVEGEDAARNWQFDPENVHRAFCAEPAVWSAEPYSWRVATCLDVPAADDEIPF